MKMKNNSTPIQPIAKPQTPMHLIKRECNTWFPGKKEWRERLVMAMMMWAQDENAIEISQFCREYIIPKATLYEWAKKYSDIKGALSYMHEALAGRRKHGSMTRKLDKEAAWKDLHLFDDAWGTQVNEYWNNLKKQSEPEQTIVVNLPDSEAITEKK